MRSVVHGARVTAIAVALSVVLVGWSSSCGGCDDYAVSGLTVHPVDGSGRLVCVDSVTISDGEFSQVLEATPMEVGCAYNGAWERAGDYTVEVAAADRATRMKNVTVTKGRCHVKPVTVSVPLDD
jgi:hypothetical protein